MMEKRLHFITRFLSLSTLLFISAVGCGDKQTQTKEDISASNAPPLAADEEPSSSRVIAPDAPEAIDEQMLLEACLKEDQLKEGWVNLCDGQSQWGWFSIGSDKWKVEEGIISIESGDPSFLCTSFQIADYELLVDFKCAADTNSGIFLRTTANPQDVAKECYELNIAPPDNPFPTGSLVKRKKVDPEEIGEVAANSWHTYRVLAEGATIKVWLDDKPVLEYTDPNPLRRGYISLQRNIGSVEFRNILMRPLGIQQLPLGDDWETAWNKAQKSDAKFTVTASNEGLRLKGGSGRVESKEQWDDFVLQATYQLARPEVNSGIFFRCIPGGELLGYECQLNHAFENGHRIMPKDYGAGGIFNRQKARIVVGDGTVPTYVTILAEDHQFTTWINGLQIADFADSRPANANPRAGARREAGTIALQGHDESTEVLFSKIGIAKIARNSLQPDSPVASPVDASQVE